MHTDTARPSVPAWLWTVVALGIVWNVFGLVQLADFILQTRESLMMKGMSAPAADIYYGLPIWMKAAFAIGSFGGLAGSIALGARNPIAIPVFAVSLAGYVALFLGDLAYGVFDVIPGQMAILSVVLLIAAGLFAASLIARRSPPP